MRKGLIKLLAIEMLYYISLYRIISIYVIDIFITPERWNRNMSLYLNLSCLSLWIIITYFILNRKGWQKDIYNLIYKIIGLFLAVFTIMDSFFGITQERYIPFISIVVILGVSFKTLIFGIRSKVRKGNAFKI
jgi:hypothetical protein